MSVKGGNTLSLQQRIGPSGREIRKKIKCDILVMKPMCQRHDRRYATATHTQSIFHTRLKNHTPPAKETH